MKKISVLLTLLFFLFLPEPGYTSEQQYVKFEFGIEADWTGDLNISEDKLPSRVRQEAGEPWIFNQRTKEFITKAQIESFNPSTNLTLLEFKSFLRVFLGDYKLQPFLEFGISVCKLNPFQGNKYNLAIVYSRQISDREIDGTYWYGMDCQYDLFSPGIGASYKLSRKWQVLARLQKQRMTLRYMKGLEIPGSPFFGYLLAKTNYEVWTHSLQANHSVGDHLNIAFGPWVKRIRNLETSWGVQASTTWMF